MMKIITFSTILLFLFSFQIGAQEFSLRINTGGSEVGYNGETFVADAHFNTGSTLDRPQTGLPEPYQSFRYSPSQQMSYAIPLTDGEYIVKLHFAELWFGATGGGAGGVGSRIFDVSIEGVLTEDNLDVFTEVGADAMLMKSHNVTVTGGVLNIDFDSRGSVGGERHPIINAIEILGEQTPEDIAIEGFDVWRAPPSGDSGPGAVGDLNDGDQIRNYENSYSFEGVGVEITDGVKSVFYEYTDPAGTTRNEAHNRSDNGYISPFYAGREIGIHTVSATPYSEADQGGIAGSPLTISYEIIDSCEAVSFEVVNATVCDPDGGYIILRDEANNYESWRDYVDEHLSWMFDEELNAYVSRSLSAGVYTTDYYSQYGCASQALTIETDECDDPCYESLVSSFTIETTPWCDSGGGSIAITPSRPDLTVSAGQGYVFEVEYREGNGGLPTYYSTALSFGNYDVLLSDVDTDCSVTYPFIIEEIFDCEEPDDIAIEGFDVWRAPPSGDSGPGAIGNLNDDDRIRNFENNYSFEGVGIEITEGVKSVLYEYTNPAGMTRNEAHNTTDNGYISPLYTGKEIGFYTVTATPYSEANQGGVAGTPVAIFFEVIDSCEEVYFEVVNATTCNPGGGYAILRDKANNYDPEYDYTFSGGWNNLGFVYNEELNAYVTRSLYEGTYSLYYYEDYGCSLKTFTIETDICGDSDDFALRINAGGTEVDYNDETYFTDTYFNTGSVLDRPQTGLPEPYQTFRFSRSQQMSYDIPIPDGSYTVNLYFAELWFGATGGGTGGVGSRVFDINIEGELVEDNLDVFAEVGADAQLMKAHTIIVTGGILNIDFDSRDAVGGERHPIINAIEILGEVSEPVQRPFVTTWKTDNPGTSNDVRISIPTHPDETYNYTVNWGDGTTDSGVTGDIHHDYNATGNYEVSIWGDFPRIYFNDFFFEGDNDSQKIVSVNQWGDIEWSNMQRAFQGCKNLDVKAMDVPNLTNVNSMGQMFDGCSELKGTISFNDWNIYNINFTGWMFRNASSFNQDIGAWDVSNIISTWSMFENASSFNQNIGEWDVSNVKIMTAMFSGAESFNHDIGDWDVSEVHSMDWMFQNAKAFNQNIKDWDVSSTNNLDSMFSGAENFNQDIGDWDVSNVSYMDDMFLNAVTFDQDLGGWDVSGITWNPNASYEGFGDMFANSGLSNENYDKILIGWSQLPLRSGDIVLSAPQNLYCEAQEARQHIIDTYGWTINDAGKAEDCSPVLGRPFIIEVIAYSFNDNSVTIPVHPNYTYNYTVDWGDGSISSGVTGNISHTYDTNRRVGIEISGNFPGIYYNNGEHIFQPVKIVQWGDIEWRTFEGAFHGCDDLTLRDIADVPDLSNVSSMRNMFDHCNNLVGNSSFNDWDVSNVTDMTETFKQAPRFNIDIGDWNVANVETLEGTFAGAAAFNQDLSNWDVSNVENMFATFNLAPSFDQDLGGWDIQNVTNLGYFLNNTGMSTSSYDSTLEAWANLNSLNSNLNLGAVEINYCNAGDARQKLMEDYGWTVEDAGKAADCIAPSDFALRINTGGYEVEYNDEIFVADAYFSTGSTLDRPQTGLPEPYQTFRYSPSQQMGYDIPIEDGEYTVNLYFAELWFGATSGGNGGVGSRVFDVNIEGDLIEDNLDVFAEVGADAMLKRSHTVTVTGGVLDIDFDSRSAVGGQRHPVINAIEIIANVTSLPSLALRSNSESVNRSRLSPNPVISTTSLSFENPVQLSDIQVFDVSGRLVRTYKAAEVSVDGAYDLKVHGLESGTYFINALDKQGIKHQKQMVIKR